MNRGELARKIEEFIASAQVEQHYDGSIRVGFEMRRDAPKHFGDGIWFSLAAVAEILGALRTFELPKPTLDQEDYLRHIQEQTGKYDPTVMVGGPNKPPYNRKAK